MPPIVVFNAAWWQAWSLRFPEFLPAVTQPMCERYFDEACLYIDNTPQSRICADPVTLQPRSRILMLATAHIAQLYRLQSLAGVTSLANPLVGRISSAAEGSVNVQAELGGTDSPSRDWWAQTTYGLSVWQATMSARSGFYVAPPPSAATSFGGPGRGF